MTRLSPGREAEIRAEAESWLRAVPWSKDTQETLEVLAELAAVRAELEDAKKALRMGVPAMAMHARGFSQEALIHACRVLGWRPEDWTHHPETLERRRAALAVSGRDT